MYRLLIELERAINISNDKNNLIIYKRNYSAHQIFSSIAN